MVVHAFGLEEHPVVGVAPEVGHRVAAVATAAQDLQAAIARSIRTLLVLLFPPRLVADCWPQVDLFAVGQEAAGRADEDAEAALLQDVHVVVVGVAHGPAGSVFLGVLA